MAGASTGKTIGLSVSEAFSSASQSVVCFEPRDLTVLETLGKASPEDISAHLDSMDPLVAGIGPVRRELIDKENRGSANWKIPMSVPMVRVVGQVVTFAEPLEATLRRGGLGYVLDVPILEIHATGSDISEVQDNLNEKVEVLVDVYLHADDAKLSPEAVELKRKLAGLLPGF